MGLNEWTRTSPLTLSYHAVAYGNGVFAAVGPVSLARSVDEGVTWISDTSSATKVYYSVAYGGNIFVAVGSHTTSWAGNTWSAPIPHTNGGATRFLRAVVHGTPAAGGLFVAVGDAGTIVTTPDGLQWTNRTSTITDNLVDVAFGNQLFVAAAFGGKVLTSPDGVTWTVVTTVTNPFRKIGFGKGKFLAVDGNKTVSQSSDGVAWTVLSGALMNVAQMDSIKFGFDTFAVVGPGGSVHTSPDGITWTPRVSGSAQHLGGIAYGRNRFVAVGAGTKGDFVRSGEYPSGDLSALTCSAGPLTPAFNSLVQAYDVEGSAGSVTATSEDPLAIINVKIDAGPSAVVPSGTPSVVAQVPGRPRTFQIKVAARNGQTKDYSVVIHRTPWVTPVLRPIPGGFTRPL